MGKGIHQRLSLRVQPIHLPGNVGGVETLDGLPQALVPKGVKVTHRRP